MLCKVSSDTIQVAVYNTITDTGKSFTLSWNNIYDPFTFDNPYGDTNLSFSLSITADGQNYWIKLYSDSTLLKQYSNQPTYPTYNINDNITILWNKTFKIQYYNTNTSYNVKFRNRNITLSYTATANVYKVKNTNKSLPRELKTIGNKITCTLFWMHINNTWLKDIPASYWEFVKFCNNLWNKQTKNAPYNIAYTSDKYWILRGNFTNGTNVQIKINDLEIFNASLTSANQITIPPITIAPWDIIFVYGNGTNNCYIDLFW